MSYNVKNYTKQGGEHTVIGGKLEVLDGATVEGITGISTAATASKLGGIKASAKGAGDTVEVKINTSTSKLYVPAYPVADNVPEAAGETPTAAEFKALLDALIAAGLMANE